MLNFKNTRLFDQHNEVIVHLAGNNATLNGRFNSVLTIKHPQLKANIHDLQQHTSNGKISSYFTITRDNGTFIFTAFIDGNDPDTRDSTKKGFAHKDKLGKAFLAISKYIQFLQLGNCPISIISDLGLSYPTNRYIMSIFRRYFEDYKVNVYPTI